MDFGDKQKDPTSTWLNWHQELWKGWTDAARSGMDAASKFGPSANIGDPAAWNGWLKQWSGFWQGLFGPHGFSEDRGLGNTVLGRIQNAVDFYNQLLTFWGQAFSRLEDLPRGEPLKADHIRDLQEKWLDDYQKVMESLWSVAPTDVQETAKTFWSTVRTATGSAWSFMDPVFENLEQVPELMKKAALGDTGALGEMAGLFRKNYEATIGRSALAPTPGFFGDLVKRVQQAFDAYYEFNSILQEYMTLFYNTGLTSQQKVMARLQEFTGREVTPETLRELYRVWWTSNEDTYSELFHSKEFTTLLNKVVRHGLLFRKRLDALSDEVFRFTNLPTRTDMDEVYQAVYQLRREVRRQGKTIRDLEKRLSESD